MALFLVTGGLKSPAVGHLLTRGLGSLVPIPLDLLEAIVARLLGDVDVSGVVGSKVYSDFARGPVPPYLLIVDVSDKSEYESIDNADEITTLNRLMIQVSCFHTGKKTCKDMAKFVAAALNDAPLVFEDGDLLYLRLDSNKAIPEPTPGPGTATSIYHRALTFEAISEGTL
jgi:hypothetical protein